MIAKGFNDVQVLYQIAADNDCLPNEAILIHRDNGGTLVIQQQESSIVLDLHRGNIKQFVAALDQAVKHSELAAQKAAKK